MACGIGVRELGRLLSISPSQISQWENGDRVPNVETVAMIVGALRLSPGDRRHILELARRASEPHWLSVGVNGIPQQLAAVVECERAACAIVHWVPIGIPGLLQTSDYVREIKLAAEIPPSDIELRVMIHAGRRDVLTRHDDPVRYTALIGEAIFRECVGSPEIMREQFRFLVEMAQRPNVTIQTVPDGIGWHPGWSGRFVLYEFPDASPVVYFEHHSSGAFVSAEHDIAEYRRAIERLRAIARGPAASIEHLRGFVEREKVP
jgi:transcriptional regulator with XRE-family HTH domain